MSASSALPKSCPKCGETLPTEATEGLCPNCLMGEAMQPTLVSDASKPKHSAILTPEELAPFFPQYEILRMLGRGGMGAVYLARQISLNRLVAIKILPADLSESDMGFAERFKNEAQAMAQLSHAGIVAVYDFGQTTNGLLYIVMEYIEGTDVQLMLASQGRLHSAHAMAITAHVCDALQYAHSCGIIHRDIKPSNIMVGNNGVVKVADFGLAKMSQGQTTGLTQSGMAMGTLHFMAPEALTLGSAVDQRADIYAVGVMLYQMLTGKLPQGMFEMPSFQVPGLDPRYDRIVAKALRDDREVRYQAAADLRHDLDAILTQPVEKVAPEANEVKALPPAEERAKKAKAQRLPKIEVGTPVPTKKSSAGMIITLVGVAAAVVAGWFFLSERGQKAGGMSDGGGIMGGPDTVHATPTTKVEEASIEHPFVNSLGMKFVPVPGTKVLFGIWHTRVKDYGAFAKTNKVDDSWTRQQIDGVDVGREPDHPVVGVNWDDAQAFCQWLTARDIAADRVPSGAKYRLPTDEEWSIAAGLPLESGTPAEKGRQQIWVFPWGKDFPPPEANVGNYADSFYYQKLSHTMLPRETNASDSKQMAQYSDGFITTSPVGTFPANAFGLYDMGGNVWQMCADWFDDSHQFRVRRGSAWNSWTFGYLRLNSRNQAHPDDRINVTGFRCVLELPAAVVAATVAPTSSVASVSKDTPFINTLGMKFVPVPIGGGPTKGEPVLFSIWDTRVQDYLAFARAKKVDGGWQEQQMDGVPVGRELDHPVVGVNWEDAQAFCQWLTAKETTEGKLPPGMKYRLPSDEEWSWAAGMPSEPGATPAEKNDKNEVDFPWGIGYPPPGKLGNYADETYHAKFPNPKAGQDPKAKNWVVGYDDGYATTSPVGSFPVNAYGLHDMGGNVFQWCEDWYDENQKERVLRGASWDSPDRNTLRSSRRRHSAPKERGYDHGFRCVLASASNVSSASPSLPVSSSPSSATKDSPFINTLGMKFVPVPISGGPTGGQRVLFSIWETRVQDYEVFAKETKREWLKAPFEQGQTHPAVNLSWTDAQSFCAWLTERERKAGKIGSDVSYRLPSDHEWSCAAGVQQMEDLRLSPKENQGRVGPVYAWGKAWPPPARAGNFSGKEAAGHEVNVAQKIITSYHDDFPLTAPVGSFAPDRHGIFDLAGNVWEFCEDLFTPESEFHVSRGGSFLDYLPQFASLGPRAINRPNGLASDRGFRVVLAPDVSPSPSSHVSASSTITKDAPFINTLGMKFVPVPGTDALMCIHETRRKDYATYAAGSPGADGSWKDENAGGFTLTGNVEDHPVMKVSLEDAQKFCAWLSQKEGKTYRLPTDQEWSIAAGIGQDEKWQQDTTPATVFKNQTDFPWGTQWPPPKGSGNFSDLTRKTKVPDSTTYYLHDYEDGFPTTAPVMSFQPNQIGLYDLSGNVMEWCEDWYDNVRKERVLRGGSWNDNDRIYLLSSYRGHSVPDSHNGPNGFRVVLVPPVPPAATEAPRLKVSSSPMSASKESPFTNTLGMKFVPVPITGGPMSGQRVLFSIWETRVQDYEVFVREKKHEWSSPPYQQQALFPAGNTSFEDAQAFCAWLTERERKAGWLASTEAYRLPSDHEWSCAVGIGPMEDASLPASQKHLKTPDVYPWGTAYPPPPGAGNYNGEEAVKRTFSTSFKPIPGYDDGYPAVAPVGSFHANPFGLFDLGGNLWEICEDRTEGRLRVTGRGACFLNSPARELLASWRSEQTHSAKEWGFRVVLATAPPSTPATATKDSPFTNSLGMKFTPLPGTKSLMSIHETRNADYAAFATAVPAAGSGWKRAAGANSHPVVGVSWEEAAAFCAWLSQKENRRYRLPKDREWSIAVQIDTREAATATPQKLGGALPGVYPWGTQWPPPGKVGNYAGSTDGFATAAPVMSFAPNALGFFDLGGNVWEYCSDGFNESGQTRVLRGASWSDAEQAALLSSCRDPIDPSARSGFVGFRCVLDDSEP